MERMRTFMARSSTVAAAASLILVGLAGSSVAAESSVVTVVGDQSSKGGASWAQCPTGTHLIGGGYLGGESQAPVTVSAPSMSHPGMWAAQATYSYVRAYALCDKKSAPTSAVAGSHVTGGGVSYAQCPANTDLIGGGYAARFGYNGLHQTNDVIEADAPSAVHPGAWAAKSSNGAMTAYALCRARD
ncbi:hypothetical protein DN069_21580 [Streptacidiphilus pinicola]|uniref:Uncharacterized protein n=1 Tax=Streptacidiphilus pinicola TaxID=2219663 RepID=A0A2X0K2T1_9ACTN|nr:hypothetical protein DN069_21580 [Streptacidiphilus pinicola]